VKRSRTDIVAEAIARSELTEKGKRECVWFTSWSRKERQHYRNLARAAIRSIDSLARERLEQERDAR
jgi:hypothetical protein